MKCCDAAWAAGVVDGEGCILLRRNKHEDKIYYRLDVVVAQAGLDCPPMIVRLRRLFKGNISGPTWKNKKTPMWYWQVVGAAAERCLYTVLANLTEKKQQALVALDYRKRAVGRGKQHLAEAYHYKLQSMKSMWRKR